MADSENITAQDASTKKADNAPAHQVHAQHSAFSRSLGSWAFHHKALFNSTWGNVFFNNFLRTMVAIVPYAIVNMAVFHAFKPIHKNKETNFLKITLGDRNGIIEGTTRIAFSFTAFRSVNKIWNRAYERVFGAKSEQEAADAISDLPKNMIKDSADIIPREFCATAPAALTLGAIRGGVLNEAGAHNSFPRDWGANAFGYAAFFPVTEGLYRGFEARQKQHDAAKGIEAYPGEHTKKLSPSTTDTLPKVLFRNAGSVLGAAVPYMAAQRWFIKEFGQISRQNSYGKNLKSWLWQFEIPFAIFTSGIELYQKAYDDLAQKLDKKYTAKQITH